MGQYTKALGPSSLKTPFSMYSPSCTKASRMRLAYSTSSFFASFDGATAWDRSREGNGSGAPKRSRGLANSGLSPSTMRVTSSRVLPLPIAGSALLAYVCPEAFSLVRSWLLRYSTKLPLVPRSLPLLSNPARMVARSCLCTPVYSS